MKHDLSLFIFRRDLRLEDNTALITALRESKKVMCCFIFDKRQVKNNSYRSDFLVHFMINSLKELQGELKKKGGNVYFFYGYSEGIVEDLLKEHAIGAVYVNRDYSPFSQKRDATIEKICKKHAALFYSFDDLLLNAPGSVLKDDGTPYTVFTPFYRKALSIEVAAPTKNTFTNYYGGSVSLAEDDSVFRKVLDFDLPQARLKGGRKEALRLLREIHSFIDYGITRNIPIKDATSHLSAHHKFGTVSIREVYCEAVSSFGMTSTFVSELYWRDFFTHILYFFPHVLGGCFRKKYDALEWNSDAKKFKAWCEGKTGFPIVDAGMRELNTTGFMHNRVRMIVASFLVKDLHIDWRKGEQYFAQKLIDYDVAVNNGNWQWAASTGCDAQPYFRIFNPWSQQEKFDVDCLYIKKWVPELKDLTAKEIHSLYKVFPKGLKDYPKPIVDHKVASAQAKAMFSVLK